MVPVLVGEKILFEMAALDELPPPVSVCIPGSSTFDSSYCCLLYYEDSWRIVVPVFGDTGKF